MMTKNLSKAIARGIDVSQWQGAIDWKKVKAEGIDFAMIRLGYGSPRGTSCTKDRCFEQNVANAVKAGIDVGCYFYSYAMSVPAAKREAAFVVSILQKYKGVFTYPVAFDLEDRSQQGIGKNTLTGMVIAFGEEIEKAGFYCALYSNLTWLKNHLDENRLARFDHWVAQWAAALTYEGAAGMWQNSARGRVNGISGNVDTDLAYRDYPALIRKYKLNGFGDAEEKLQTYTVMKGDSLWGIAKKFLGSGFRYTEIVKLNGLKTSMIHPGQTLRIPKK